MRSYLIYFVAMWGVHLVNSLVGYALNIFGVNPNWSNWLTQLTNPSIGLILSIPLTLLGFVSHPFLHGSNAHIINNSLAYIPLGLLVAATENFRTKFWRIAIGCGALSWLLVVFGSRNGITPVMVGASGVIYGFIGYLLASSVHRFCFINVLFAIAAWIISGNAIGGMLPWAVPEQVSWEGHLAGFVAGAVTAFSSFQNAQPAPVQQPQDSMFSSGFPFSG